MGGSYGRGRNSRKRERKNCAFAWLAADGHTAVMGQHHLLYNCQPQTTAAAIGAAARPVATPEAVKDKGQIGFGDAFPRILHRNLYHAIQSRRV